MDSVWHQFSLDHLSTASNWIGVQTGVHGFDSRTPHKPVVSKTFEVDIWLSSYDHLTDVGGQGCGCQQLSQWKGAFFLLNKKEALSGLIQANDDEERNGGQAGRVYGFQLLVTRGIQSGLSDVSEQWVWCFISVWQPGLIPVFQKDSSTLYSQP